MCKGELEDTKGRLVIRSGNWQHSGQNKNENREEKYKDALWGELPERRYKSNNKEKVLDLSWSVCIGNVLYYLYRFRAFTSHDIQEEF
jgi:hypothetical protein